MLKAFTHLRHVIPFEQASLLRLGACQDVFPSPARPRGRYRPDTMKDGAAQQSGSHGGHAFSKSAKKKWMPGQLQLLSYAFREEIGDTETIPAKCIRNATHDEHLCAQLYDESATSTDPALADPPRARGRYGGGGKQVTQLPRTRRVLFFRDGSMSATASGPGLGESATLPSHVCAQHAKVHAMLAMSAR